MFIDRENHKSVPDGKSRKTAMLRRWIFAAFVCSVFSACGPDPLYLRLKVALDTSVHHLANGYKLMAHEKFGPARREFERALELDPQNREAHMGLGLLSGHQLRFEEGKSHLDTALSLSDGPEKQAEVNLAQMRLLTMGQNRITSHWLKRVEDHFKKIIRVVPESQEAYYHMGMACKAAFQLDNAASFFHKASDMKGGLKKEIRRQLATILIIQSAYPVSRAGKSIALKEIITRLDLAVLLNREMDLEDSAPNGEQCPATISDDPALIDRKFIPDVHRIILLSLDGLSVDKEGFFYPGRIVTRMGLARVLSHILVQNLNDPGIATRYIGVKSPFLDVPVDIPYYNAVMLVTERDLIKIRHRAGAPGTWEFKPTDTVSGAEAMESLRALQHQIAIRHSPDVWRLPFLPLELPLGS